MKTVAIIQARMGSTRLPGKVLRPLAGRPALQWTYEAARAAPGVDQAIVATTPLSADDEICQQGFPTFRGSELDVLDRFYQAAAWTSADVICRITGDCPFLDPLVLGEVIRLRKATGAAYASNIDPPTWPDGLDCEVFTRNALEQAYRQATRSIDRDTVTQYLTRNRAQFRNRCVISAIPSLYRERWVLDTGADYEFCTALANRLGRPGRSYLDILDILDAEPWIRDFNKHGIRNERFYQSLAEESVYDRTLN